MDSMPVNWIVLDNLVMDYVKSEKLLVEDDTSSTSSSSSSSSAFDAQNSRQVIHRIRNLIENGSIDEVLDLLKLHAPSVLSDQHLIFRLQKQKFIELLRRGGADARDLAIKCSRTALGPCALNAYPEAYEEFKRVLLAFIYDKDDQTSPVTEEWSEKRRSDLAALMASVLKARLHAYDPCFSQTLRYLISIHHGYCYRRGVTSPISEITNKLLLEERDPAAILQECLYGAPQFNEVDVQALAHAVELPRQGAIDSLRYTNGDLFTAFQNELSRMKLNVPMVDDLVREYCVYRGLIDGGLNPPSGSEVLPTRSSKHSPQEPMLDNDYSKEDSFSLYVNCGEVQESDVETSVNDAMVEDFQDACLDGLHKTLTDVEFRSANETIYGGEVCSTSGACQTKKSGIQFNRLRSSMGEERGTRQRWRGRHYESELQGKLEVTSTENDRDSTDALLDLNSKLLDQNLVSLKGGDVNKYSIVLEMRELASKGMIVKVVDQVKQWNPLFFEQNPVLLFQLKQIEFLKLVEDGDYTAALRVARSDLGPLATKDPNLLKPLKETVLALATPKECASLKYVPLSVIATALQVALGASLGIEEPLLMKIMRATLYSHTEWFKLQMCADRFEKFLRINELKEIKCGLLTGTKYESNLDSCSGATSQVTANSSNILTADSRDQTQEPSREVLFDETAILQVMEFLALPRSDAIQLLAQYDGSADVVFQQIFT